jgi:hypothetical protein
MLAARLRALLYVALTLVFASAGAAHVVDRFQHQPGAAGAHQHLAFSNIVFEAHDDGHPDHDDDASDHRPGTGNHHHVDSGSGLLTPLSHKAIWMVSGDSSWRRAGDSRIPGFLTHGPERPPKSRAIRS